MEMNHTKRERLLETGRKAASPFCCPSVLGVGERRGSALRGAFLAPKLSPRPPHTPVPHPPTPAPGREKIQKGKVPGAGWEEEIPPSQPGHLQEAHVWAWGLGGKLPV